MKLTKDAEISLLTCILTIAAKDEMDDYYYSLLDKLENKSPDKAIEMHRDLILLKYGPCLNSNFMDDRQNKALIKLSLMILAVATPKPSSLLVQNGLFALGEERVLVRDYINEQARLTSS